MKKIFTAVSLILVCALAAACGSAPSSAPAYDKSALEPSEFENISGDVSISISGDPAKDDELVLTYENHTDADFNYTALQRLEVQLDGTWYVVPDAQDFVTMQLLTLPANGTEEDTFRIEGRYEPFPSGTYRIVKSFTGMVDGGTVNAAVEFTVQ